MPFKTEVDKKLTDVEEEENEDDLTDNESLQNSNNIQSSEFHQKLNNRYQKTKSRENYNQSFEDSTQDQSMTFPDEEQRLINKITNDPALYELILTLTKTNDK